MLAYLQFGSNDLGKYSVQYQVKDVRCRFIRPHNEYRPSGDAFCESIEISAFVTSRNDRGLIEWFTDGEGREGRLLIEIADPAQDSATRFSQISFSDARCFSLKEEYLIDSRRRLVTFGFISREIIADGITFIR